MARMTNLRAGNPVNENFLEKWFIHTYRYGSRTGQSFATAFLECENEADMLNDVLHAEVLGGQAYQVCE
ncbi:uncharacterized protein MEPE_05282 [Melanopsichium pennsylvanicum]|uniref:Uncharacterized protein n=2 Tax=Melanopsichium pennsylvanicum TaxID=63383 RepID=A0AAJ4XT14_9BASI|nr:uncharacterized protein BN887_06231 [Melanopsichium pennsylvanicum 4]SNX86573.1 uncharacterized protein MEPE_05282 [Melanopsichium pennsylvanicum]